MGLALVGIRGYFKINTLNEILVFDLSWVDDLIHTNHHLGQDMGNRRRGITRSLLDVSD